MFLKIVKTGVVLLLLAVFLVFLWLAYELYVPPTLPLADSLFEVEKGMTIRDVAGALEEKGLIRARLSFLVTYRLFFYPRKIKAGEYGLRAPMKLKDILGELVKGKVYLHAVTIPEGLTGQDMAPLIVSLLSDGEEGFLAAFRNGDSLAFLDRGTTNLEGYLFPETYHFPKGISGAEVVQAMLIEFRSVFSEAWLARAQALRMSVRQIVVLASLIEKETSIPEERRLVSAVFHNRLRLGMKLDCDPTIIYALKLEGKFDGRLGKKDMARDSPYNTYLHPGLPPGPICNPGKGALEAALFPAEEHYLYFVSRNDGSHHFSRSFAEHQAAVRRYQKRA